ncbi:DUF3078 domain-containing protein [Mucilaginibacter aquaedulcis]|uniref:DUF3078 domain-containing protein n=1 Tax=Mucilaginibacter aquaedulcis TaxID=1187081 RepID=UPI0025B30460|nr:DUF3078 domain-containing protein [Mucilaginibacter aquaedulcis]MDN3550832.1 DUF3078 domain-containing protein [Mucilaginibacter aquaedulcis]
MIKTRLALLLLVSTTLGISAKAQQTDSLKRDTVIKIDTAQVNKFRIDSRRNAIPTRVRPVQLQRTQVPLNMLDYKVNYWKKSVTFGLNFSQSAFSSNYSAGGVSAVALGTNFIYHTEYNKAPFSYVSELNLLYGVSKNKGQGKRKTNDRIFFDNKLASQLSKDWYIFGALTFESQFDKGFNYVDLGNGQTQAQYISNFMSPGYVTESLGFEYKPTNYFDLRLGTGTARQTFVLDRTVHRFQTDNYGVDTLKTVKNDLAFQMVALFDKDIAKNIHLNTRYALFIPYGEQLKFITHRVDMVLSAKVNRLINVTINGTLLYDKHTSPDAQATEGLALGMLYRFP